MIPFNSFFLIFKQFRLAFFLYLSILTLLFLLFLYDKNSKIDTYLDKENRLIYEQYKNSLHSFKVISENTFFGIINKPNIYNLIKDAYNQPINKLTFYHDKLYNEFLMDYERLKQYKFGIVHFHFKDNRSFLRMHEPTKYGDSLTGYRYSVETTNSTLKPINGFEIGKHIDGFRFVYPIFDKKLEHLGSVEISVYSEYFESKFEADHNVDVHFLINKNISKSKMVHDSFTKYTISNENPEYIFNEKQKELIHFTNENFYSNDEKNYISENMKKSKRFHFIKNSHNTVLSVFFIPISNIEGITNSAYLVVYKNSPTIIEIENNFKKIVFILILMSLIFYLFMNYLYEKVQKEKEKELIMTQQAKMIAMGEMLGNIAHQWRQPLSTISTAASGVKLQKEFGMLKDDFFNETMDKIVEQTKYLSETIEDFRNFFKNDKIKREIQIKELIRSSLLVFGKSFKNSNIEIVLNIDENIKITTFVNELKQVLINLLKNAKDAIQTDGVIIVTVSKDKKSNNIELSVLDSGGGVPDDIKEKIFEPYFTTKHQSQGTGLGLNMSYTIISKNLKGTLNQINKKFTYNFKDYEGAEFIIKIHDL